MSLTRGFARPQRKPIFSKKDIRLKKNILKAVKSLPEPKHHYSSKAETTISYTGGIDDLCNPAQGGTSQEREGDRSLLKEIDIRGRVSTAAVSAGVNALRVIVFKWNVDNADTAPTLAHVLQNTYLGAATAPYAPVVVGQERKDIVILADRTFNLSYYGTPSISFHIKKKIGTRQYFNAGATTSKGSVYIAYVSDDGASLYPSIGYVSQATFVDL